MSGHIEIETTCPENNKIKRILNDVHDAIRDRDSAYLESLLREIKVVRQEIQCEEDFQSAQLLIQENKIFPILLQDPYTRHAFTKPRGFAGDASMIDFFYGHRSCYESQSEEGRLIFETLMRSPSCDAVRYRRGYYGAFLDQVANDRQNSQVLALACGHLREALFSRAVIDNSIRLVGLDSDPLAVSEAQKSLGSVGVEVRNASVVDFIRRRSWGESYDAIYAAGLFDYLDVKIGRKVIATAFEALRPGGVISVANFIPAIVEQGYMDLVMDWRLIYRSPEDMLELIPDHVTMKAHVETWTDPLKCIAYLTIIKNG